MPYCKRCGELGRAEKCKKCGTSFSMNLTSISQPSAVDRWQSSKYLDQVVGTEKEMKTSNKKKWMERRKIPSILIDKKYRVAPLDSSPSPSPHPKSRDSTCSHCHQQLAGKLVQLPDPSNKKFHWSCLLCHECHQPFQTTSVYFDSSKNIYHPKCAAISPTVQKTCHHCSHQILDQYLPIDISVMHLECFQCSKCHNVLRSDSVYCRQNQNPKKHIKDNDESVMCRPCYKNQYTTTLTIDDDVQWHVVPQPLSVQNSTSQLTYHSPTTPESCVDQSTLTPLPPPQLTAVVQPSELMSSKHYSNRQRRPIPQYGVVKICPGCQNRIGSVHDECVGPRAAKWHRQCLVCSSCQKSLDSSAKIHQTPESERLIPTCTTCLLQKQNSNQKRNSLFIKSK